MFVSCITAMKGFPHRCDVYTLDYLSSGAIALTRGVLTQRITEEMDAVAQQKRLTSLMMDRSWTHAHYLDCLVWNADPCFTVWTMKALKSMSEVLRMSYFLQIGGQDFDKLSASPAPFSVMCCTAKEHIAFSECTLWCFSFYNLYYFECKLWTNKNRWN